MPNTNIQPQSNSVPFAELLESYDLTVPEQGQYVEGQILKIDDQEILLDIGAKRDAVVPRYDLAQLDSTWLESLAPGDQVPVQVMEPARGSGELLVSIDRGLAKADWDRARECLESGEILRRTVVGYNKGGLLVQFGRLHAFLPKSQVSALRYLNSGGDLAHRKASLVGEELAVKVIAVEPRKRRLVVSARAAEERVAAERLASLSPGDILTGRVARLVDYGAFVDLDGVTGLLHISELSWEHIDRPEELVTPGDAIKVLVKKIDRERGRLSLSRKALLPDPWDVLAERYEIDDLVEGEVVNHVDFGCFVRLPQLGIDGLVHHQEMHDPSTSSEALPPGQTILVRILDIDRRRRRLSLSQKRVTMAEEIEWMSRRQHAETPENDD